MAVVKPFVCIRPNPAVASRVAALPYDVYNREEAKAEVMKEPLSFLAIDRAETLFPDEVDTYADQVYAKARALLDQRIADGTFRTTKKPCYFLYELTMDGRSQTGVVAVSAVDDYLGQVVKKHENTRADKEKDRIRHVDECNAQTGPIFLAYRGSERINMLVSQAKQEQPVYDFISADGVGHRIWMIENEASVAAFEAAFVQVPCTYIADGHHRAASAVKVGLKRREEAPGYHGDEPYNYFLSVLFPADQLMILPYNRVVADLNGRTAGAFLEQIKEICEVEDNGSQPFSPSEKGEMGMYLEGHWYRLKFQIDATDPVASLDASVLQDRILNPILGIEDPRTDKRVDFIGGIRGLSELEARVAKDMKVAFSMYPTSIDELLSVADAGLLMPPKSTWFEPKLRSGLFIHRLS